MIDELNGILIRLHLRKHEDSSFYCVKVARSAYDLGEIEHCILLYVLSGDFNDNGNKKRT